MGQRHGFLVAAASGSSEVPPLGFVAVFPRTSKAPLTYCNGAPLPRSSAGVVTCAGQSKQARTLTAPAAFAPQVCAALICYALKRPGKTGTRRTGCRFRSNLGWGLTRRGREPSSASSGVTAGGSGEGSSMMLTDAVETLPARSDEEHLEVAFQKRAEESLLNVGTEHTRAITKWNDPDWKYFDIAMIYVKGGDGGHGCKSFRHELNRPKGGPDGGNGGHGGHVYLRCERGKTTLTPLKQDVHYHAEKGEVGKGKELHGKNGAHRYVRVPPGSVVYVRDVWVEAHPRGKSAGLNELVCREDIGTRHLVGELTQVGQTLRVARGGFGGRGNRAFKTHHNTAPRISEVGSPGLGRWIEIELKLMADIGIIGVPNAGKSSLLSAVTKKEAKIAAYPFTTVVPNLGYYKADEHGGVTLCDVPGLIEGAHAGRGMGIQFLRHIERCRSLIHMVSANSEDPIGDFEQVQAELREYSTEVAMKPQVVVVNKCDVPEVQEDLPRLMAELRRRCGHSRVFDISVATRYHVDECMRRIYKWHKSMLEADQKANGTPCEEAALVVDSRQLVHLGAALDGVSTKEVLELDPERKKGRRLRRNATEPLVEWDVLEDAWRMRHPEVERVAKVTNWDMPDAAKRFNRVCRATGMTEALSAKGIKDGEPVIVCSHKFSYFPDVGEGGDSRMLYYEMDLDF